MFNLFKKDEPKKGMPCGCSMGRPYNWTFFMADHQIEIVTLGNKRLKRVTCIPTGLFWEVEMPDLKKVDYV